ncbi:nicotinate phosphoribosyltransferase [Oribacterium sinus]|uniref:Nicotinate phosphoribosyltransferase n=1 Tax=Oribacterium sinus TaxID=237576 RepID=A0A930GUL4_9FIRM|nr:nicotinate phosphoribosyltransferase [Oribacterium sinus]MBF1272338.1 nicotinate phosphoribosyltransferase [Oribacterium sinus]
MERNFTLLTDFYELTMMQGYLKSGKHQERVIFDMFYRKNPCGNGFAICCGLEQVVEYIRNLNFSEEDIDYLRSLGTFDEDFIEYLRGFHFTGDIYAIPEGTVVFPKEPLIKVIAPVIEAQLVETAILNLVNHQSLIATKAYRVVHAAQGDGVMEFGLRRAQGPDAGIYGARAAVIAGCIGTSNVYAGQKFRVPVLGTHAHSWIMSFPTELEAFKAYARLYPNNCILLVDTYDTLKSGVKNAILCYDAMKEEGITLKRFGIRLDSGDLAYLSKKARKMLDEAGYPEAIISASNDLDENLIESLKAQGACITSWGVGTNLITSESQPSFGGVYKLAATYSDDGKWVPKIKLSENSEKITNPGNKQIYRIIEKDSGKVFADYIALEDETFSEKEDLVLFDPIDTWKKSTLKGGSYEMRPLLVPIFLGGKLVYNCPSVEEIKAHCKREQESLWEECRRLTNPHAVHVDLSDKLYEMKKGLLAQYSRGE